MPAADAPPRFDARDAIRRAGFERADDLAKTAGLAGDLGGRANRYLSSTPELRGVSPAGFWELIVFAAATLLGLALLDTALRGKGPAGVEKVLGGLGQMIRKLFDPRDPIVRAGEAPAFYAPVLGTEAFAADVTKPDESTRGATATRGGAWGSSMAVVNALTATLGLPVISTKRAERDTSSGGISDHWIGSKQAYAKDLGGSMEARDRAAVVLARLLGVKGYRKGQPLVVLDKHIGGYRIQVLHRTQIGGNHDNHIHVGARRLSTA